MGIPIPIKSLREAVTEVSMYSRGAISRDAAGAMTYAELERTMKDLNRLLEEENKAREKNQKRK